MRFSSSKQILVWFEPAEDHMDMEVEKKAETRIHVGFHWLKPWNRGIELLHRQAGLPWEP
ncbi:hypothetical protein F2Q69_00026131 [Brassica cretica]|uniref:Uncharacterized protein n=1 Tax=Brassica cretica TaxID=69181 RepID=A0A8S9RT87_BRACR|nr:hypothetical protein F2Q69_00026131 [Brassica cretica]